MFSYLSLSAGVVLAHKAMLKNNNVVRVALVSHAYAQPLTLRCLMCLPETCKDWQEVPGHGTDRDVLPYRHRFGGRTKLFVGHVAWNAWAILPHRTEILSSKKAQRALKDSESSCLVSQCPLVSFGSVCGCRTPQDSHWRWVSCLTLHDYLDFHSDYYDLKYCSWCGPQTSSELVWGSCPSNISIEAMTTRLDVQDSAE